MKKLNIGVFERRIVIVFSCLCIIGLLVGHFLLEWTPGYRWDMLTSNAAGLFKMTALNESNVGTLAEHEVFEVTFDHFEKINEVVIAINEVERNIVLAGIKDDLPKDISIAQLNQWYDSGSTMYFVISNTKMNSDGKYIGYLFDEYPKRLDKDANDSVNAYLFYMLGADKTGTNDNMLELFIKKY